MTPRIVNVYKPLRQLTSYKEYYVNGYKFHTNAYATLKESTNSGVCVVSEAGCTGEAIDFFGVLQEVVKVEYPGTPSRKIVLFLCEWFDTNKQGKIVDQNYKIVDLNIRTKYSTTYEPLIFATQTSHVYYCKYPVSGKPRSNLRTVCKVKARFMVELLTTSNEEQEDPFQTEVQDQTVIINETDDFFVDLVVANP